MQYSPKLKVLMEQIKELLKENDVAAFVVLHDKEGFSEYLNAVSPSYSCAYIKDGDFTHTWDKTRFKVLPKFMEITYTKILEQEPVCAQ